LGTHHNSHCLIPATRMYICVGT